MLVSAVSYSTYLPTHYQNVHALFIYAHGGDDGRDATRRGDGHPVVGIVGSEVHFYLVVFISTDLVTVTPKMLSRPR
jgi:hypothetical protein